MSRALNRVTLIGNVVADSESRMTVKGSTVCTFTLATSRTWKTGEEVHEESQFHPIVTWDKLALLCQESVKKGKKMYIQGRLSTSKWTDKVGVERQRTEIVAEDLIFLDKKEEE